MTTVNNQERAKVEQIVSGQRVKKNAASKIKSDFIAEDIHHIGEYLWTDVLVPAVKDLISNGVSNFVDMLLYGQSRGMRTFNGNNIKRAVTPYSSLYSTNSVQAKSVVRYNEPVEKPRGFDRYSCQDVLIPFVPTESPQDTKNKATYVLTRLRMYLDEYEVVAVADLYDAVGIVPDERDNHWGWRDLSMAAIQSCRDGYLIRMPAVEAI